MLYVFHMFQTYSGLKWSTFLVFTEQNGHTIKSLFGEVYIIAVQENLQHVIHNKLMATAKEERNKTDQSWNKC